MTGRRVELLSERSASRVMYAVFAAASPHFMAAND